MFEEIGLNLSPATRSSGSQTCSEFCSLSVEFVLVVMRWKLNSLGLVLRKTAGSEDFLQAYFSSGKEFPPRISTFGQNLLYRVTSTKGT